MAGAPRRPAGTPSGVAEPAPAAAIASSPAKVPPSNYRTFSGLPLWFVLATGEVGVHPPRGSGLKGSLWTARVPVSAGVSGCGTRQPGAPVHWTGRSSHSRPACRRG
ncbi:hypothetical protein Pma05_53390 [Plantactinospora mayteni]|uniref:Uncharacterized protein n=1 Tax=Plantactinospora mayteni TaxID=566021 RepID=A0ABQ4EVV4_9ACTN|nr:hypothetical protein Pma05_53390 [Plantactinospora mayteni]